MADPAFDQSQPFDVVGSQGQRSAPAFDAGKSFDVVGQDKSNTGGIGKNLLAGFTEGLTGIPSAITDPASKVVDAISSFLPENSAPEGSTAAALGAGRKNTNPIPAGSISHALNKGLGFIGLNPEDVTANSYPERAARMAGSGATAVLFPEGGEGALAENLAPALSKVTSRAANSPLATLGRKALTGTLAGTTGATAEEAVPDDSPVLKSAVGTLAAIAGGAAAEAPSIVTAGINKAKNFALPLSAAGREQIAANTLRTRATNPENVLSNLDTQTPELVPGSQPTTFQQTGDLGLGGLEREVAAKNPAPFIQRRADQNAARTVALSGIQQQADPVDVANLFRQHINDIDAQTEAAVSDATNTGANNVASVDAAHSASVANATDAAQGLAANIGGLRAPEDYGATLRNAIVTADKAAAVSTSKLYDAVDPDGTLTGNMTGTSTAAKAILGDMRPTSMPMSAQEGAVFQAAKNLPDIAPARDLIELSKYTNAIMKNELRTNGSTPTYARLAQLRGAIQNNLDNTIADKVSQENAAVADGTMDANETLSARLEAERNDWIDRQATARAAVGDSAGQTSRSGTTSFSGPLGTESAAERGSGNAPGDQGVSDTPTFNDEAAQRLAAASQSHAQRKATFGIKPISDITASSGMKGQYVLPNGAVPAKVFHPGQKGFQDVQATLKASPESLPVIEDYAAMSLRRAAMSSDGTIDPAKFSRWSAQHQDALRALPQTTRQRFTDAATAADAVDEATAGRVQAIKEAQAKAIQDVASATAARKSALQNAKAGPAGRLAQLTEPQDVTSTVGNILNSRTAVSDMKNLAFQASRNPDAMAGLRQAVSDHISNKLISNTESGTSGQNLFKADQFQSFLRQKRGALQAVFSPEEMNTLDRISADLKRANRSISGTKLPGGSNTAQDIHGMLSNNPNATVLDHALAEGGAAIAGAAVGHATGAGLGWMGAKVANAMRASGMKKVDDLLTGALLNPDLAKDLLRKAPAQADSGQSIALASRLRRIATAAAATRLGTYSKN